MKSNPIVDDSAVSKRRRQILGIITLTAIVLAAALITIFVSRNLIGKIRSPEDFRVFIDSFGWTGRLVFFGLQLLQVVIAFIPGEPLEIGAGYAFGAVEGTLLCMAGVAVGSTLIFILTRRFGVKLVELFFSREKINDLRFINSEKKLKRLIFILFFIPGTPKDLFTYFAGLTRIRLYEFLTISILARIPSVISSTVGGNLFGSSQYVSAIILFGVTGIISLGGIALYSRIIKHHQKSDKKHKL